MLFLLFLSAFSPASAPPPSKRRDTRCTQDRTPHSRQRAEFPSRRCAPFPALRRKDKASALPEAQGFGCGKHSESFFLATLDHADLRRRSQYDIHKIHADAENENPDIAHDDFSKTEHGRRCNSSQSLQPLPKHDLPEGAGTFYNPFTFPVSIATAPSMLIQPTKSGAISKPKI